MKAFIPIPKDMEFLSPSYFDFDVLRKSTSINYLTLFNNLNESFKYIIDNNLTGYCVAEIEFTDDTEILEAICNSIHGDNTMSKFNIKVLNFYSKEEVL